MIPGRTLQELGEGPGLEGRPLHGQDESDPDEGRIGALRHGLAGHGRRPFLLRAARCSARSRASRARYDSPSMARISA